MTTQECGTVRRFSRPIHARADLPVILDFPRTSAASIVALGTENLQIWTRIDIPRTGPFLI